ncbi:MULTISPECIES: cysteine rich repeat-containing protein [Actinoalloteichus]|uniref:cysteine rich repeat-containing protein n=1 Tax=Actinoalloteichus TaxID=65496 RepID=UPI0012F73DAB|nr:MULTISPECIES: hypothetical protein [Actinoalloteichus]
MTEVVEQLRRAHALLVVAREAAVVAEFAIGEGGEIFDEGTAGSVWPQVQEMRRLRREAGEDVRLAHAAMVAAQEIIDEYCFAIAGHGVDGAAVFGSVSGSGPSVDEEVPAPAADTRPPGRDTAAQREAEADWIADRERAGVVINPKNVTRIARLPDGRIVWVEGRNKKGGQEHILDDDRVGHFRRVGVPRERVIPLVFAALEGGTVVGYSGKDRPVYEVVFDGEVRRVAITVTRDGLIVGAHPISLKRKLRPRLHRS